MADYIFIRKSRNIVSSVLHIILNLLLGIGSILITVVSGGWLLGALLVILAKWRMFAVRPRFWPLNFRANLVDIIVGLSFVLIAFCAGSDPLPVHYLLALGYSLWLLFLKSGSSEHSIEAQALIAVFLGTTAASLLATNIDSIVLVLAAFIIGYAACNHIVSQSDDHDFNIIPLISGLFAAEIAWLCHTWFIVYSFASSGLVIPQSAIILTTLSLLAVRAYKSINKRDGYFKFSDIAVPTLFSITIIVVLILGFSQPVFNI